jgi:phenylacetate-CoA ligase
MALRRLGPREYLVNLVAVTVLMPVYGRRERARRPELDRFAFNRARAMAIHAAGSVPVYRDRYAAAGVDPRSLDGWASFERLPLMDKETIRAGFPERSTAAGSDLARCILSTSSGSSGLVMTIPHRADRLWPYVISSQRMLRWAAGDRYPFWYRQA